MFSKHIQKYVLAKNMNAPYIIPFRVYPLKYKKLVSLSIFIFWTLTFFEIIAEIESYNFSKTDGKNLIRAIKKMSSCDKTVCVQRNWKPCEEKIKRLTKYAHLNTTHYISMLDVCMCRFLSAENHVKLLYT